MRRRIAALLLAAAMLSAITGDAAMEETPELPTDIGAWELPAAPKYSKCSDWAESELLAAQDAGLFPSIFVDADMTKNVTRGEFAAVAVQLYEKMSGKTAPLPPSNVFVDTESAYVLRAHAAGIVQGVGGGRFEPNSPITRQDAATMLVRVYKAAFWEGWSLEGDGEYDKYSLDYSGVTPYSDDGEVDGYAYPSVYFLTKRGVLGGMGDGRFAPLENCSREQAVAMAMRMAELNITK